MNYGRSRFLLYSTMASITPNLRDDAPPSVKICQSNHTDTLLSGLMKQQMMDIHTGVNFYCVDRIISCHRFILECQSPFLKDLFRQLPNFCTCIGSSCVCGGETQVSLFLAEVDGRLAEKVVRYLYTGQLFVDNQEMYGEVNQLCASLGINIPTSELDVTAFRPQMIGEGQLEDDGVTSEEELQVEENQPGASGGGKWRVDQPLEFVDAAGDDSEEMEIQVQPEPSKQSKNEKTKKIMLAQTRSQKKREVSCRVTCPNCSFSCTTPSMFREHLSLKHYKKQLEKKYMSAGGSKCSICKFTGNSVTRHIGSVHKRVDEFLTTEEKKKLGKLSATVTDRSSKRDDLDSIKPERNNPKMSPSQVEIATENQCHVCYKNISNKSGLRNHLVVHYKKQIVVKYGVESADCPIPMCSYQGTSFSKAVLHVAIFHGKLDEFVKKASSSRN